MLRNPLTKGILAILLGTVFFLGGASVASAQAMSTQPTGLNQAQTDATDAANAGDTLLKGIACNPFPLLANLGIGSGTFGGCVSQGFYYLFYIPLSWVMVAGAFIFDAMLTLSIDSSFILQPFINDTWTVVRDFSNMLFIFILLYTGVQTILGLGSWTRTIIYVVVMALLINFSLFFTKVVIDAGNILSVGVYQAIAPEKTGSDKNLATRTGGLPERNVSFALTRGFQPQSFIGKTANVQPLDAMIIFIIAGVVSAFAGYIFFKAAILFSRRLVVFWGLMILSPFAFISMALPGKANQFQSWLDELIAQTFVAPVFLFFIYIIMQVVNSGVLSGLTNHQSGDTFTSFTFDKVLLPVIVASLIIKALQEALKYAEGMAGSTGAEFSGLVAGAMGMAGGVATGGASLVAQKTIGRGALALAGSDRFKSIAAKSPIGRVAYSLTDKAANSTFDVRNAPGGSSLGIGKGGEGSFKKTVEETKKADVEFGKKIMYDKDGKLIPGAADAYAAQLEKGYTTRRGTGGNLGAKEAVKEVVEEKKAGEKKAARIPELEKKIAATKKAVDDLSTSNGNLVGDALTLQLKANLRAAEASARVMEEAAVRNPTDGQAQVDSLRAKRDKESAEKNLKKAESASDDLEKMEKQLEEYKK